MLFCSFDVKPVSVIFVFILSLQLFSHYVVCITHYCVDGSTKSIQGETTGLIHTIIFGQNKYGNNLDCSWVIDGGPNTRIQLRIVLSDLQYAPTYVTCFGYDNLNIREGANKQSNVKVSICGESNPYEVVSTGRYLHLNFFSNDKNYYDHQGIKLEFEVFNNTDCPPNWKSNTSTNECYRIMQNPTKGLEWEDAQDHCGYSQSNLATYNDIRSFEFLQEYGSNLGLEQAWIGLNDIESEGSMKWLNGSTVGRNIIKRFQATTSNDIKDCVAHNFRTNGLQYKACTRNKLPFVCLQNREGGTTVFKAPDPPIETDVLPVHHPPHSQAWTLTVVAVSCMFVGISLYACLRIRKRQLQRQMEFTEMNLAAQQSEPLTNDSGSLIEPPTIHIQSLENFTNLNKNVSGNISSPPPSYDEAVSQKS